MKNYQYYLFDLDGTLTNPKKGITLSVQYALKAFGIEVEDPDDLICFIGPPLVDSFHEFYGFDEKKAILARDKYRERYEVTGIFENEVLPGVPELLAALQKAGKKLAVASSKPEIMVRRILDRYDLAKYFDEVVGSGMNGEREQKEDVIREVFVRFSLTDDDREKVLMIGDRLHDIRGAKRCGIDSLGTYIGFAAPGELEAAGATYVAGDMEQMRQLLLEEI